MQQFRPLPRIEKIEEAEPAEVQPGTTTDSSPSVSAHTTGRMPVLLFSGPHPTPATDQLAALTRKPASTDEHPTLTSALQATMGANRSTSRLLVIHADKKRKKTAQGAEAPSRRMNPRWRHAIVLLATLGVLIGTLVTLVPLTDNQNGFNFFSNFGNWVHVAQVNWEIQAHMNMSQSSSGNGSLPPMALPTSQYVSIAQQDAIDAGISPVYFVRQINQESHFNPNAVSPAGAEGIAQFLPSTAANLGINPLDPIQALKGAARMMANSYHQYGDYAKALAAYNAGGGSLQNAEYACGVNWLSCMPAETQHYVYIIMGV